MAFAGVVRDLQINDGLVVEVASAQIVDIVADGRELEAEEALAGAEVAQKQEEVELGVDRATLTENLTFRCRQREE